eukprot:gene8198-11089_t
MLTTSRISSFLSNLRSSLRMQKKLLCNYSVQQGIMQPDLQRTRDVDSFIAVHVRGWVNKPLLNDFYKDTVVNAANSLNEVGVSRFDFLKRIDQTEQRDSNEFLLIEVYKDSQAPVSHKQTKHYQSWRDNVAQAMASPRQALSYSVIYPSLSSMWDTKRTITSMNALQEFPASNPWNTSSSDYGPSAESQQFRSSLLAVMVEVNVKPGCEKEFIEFTIENCKNSINEPGVTRFDFLRRVDNPSSFLLVEIYNNANAPAQHKQTSHYNKWAKAVEGMMATPRSARKYGSLFPETSNYSNKDNQTSSKTPLLSRGLTGSPTMFSFQGPKIMMGSGCAESAIKSSLTSLHAKKPLLIAGSPSGLARIEPLLRGIFFSDDYKNFNYNDHVIFAMNEPTVEQAVQGAKFAADNKCDCIISIGGGSSIDLGKAIAALATNNDRDVYDFLEVIGKGMPISNRPLPLIAVPTTAGTGSEATKNSVLKSVEHGRKVSIRHDMMFPVAVIIDPKLTMTCSESLTAHVGMDALCQLIEPYVSNSPNPFTDALAKEGIIRASRSLREAVHDGANDVAAREDMAVASVFSGLALANAKLGIVHGFASVLGGMFETAPHGAICAVLLPYSFEKNVEKLTSLLKSLDAADPKRHEVEQKLVRFDEVSQLLLGANDATAVDGVMWLHSLLKDIKIPPLSQLCGITESDYDVVIKSTLEASSTKGNPIQLSSDDLLEILRKAK